MTEAPGHIPVLVDETRNLLAPHPGEVVVDCTLGGGGHAAAIMERIGSGGSLIAFDVDAAAIEKFQNRKPKAEVQTAKTILIHDSFANVEPNLLRLNLQADVVFADLGFSSMQMDDPARGFSFATPGPLDMRLNPQPGMATAAQLLARLPERELADVIFRYGEEPLARKIARKVAQTRQRQPIESTQALADLVIEAYGRRARFSRMHPATRTFMALRIAVNDELGALQRLVEAIARGAERIAAGVEDWSGVWLRPGARIGIISFHSLEDRLVKHAFADLARRGLAERLTKKPVTAGESERSANPRSRSAKLRAVRIREPHCEGSHEGIPAGRTDSGRSG